MSDFIREVDEDYRRERIMRFIARFQVPIVALVVLIIVGAGAWRFWSDSKLASAQKDNARYTAAEWLDKQGKGEAAQAAFEAIGRDGPAGYAMLARMRAMELLAERDADGAAKGFDAIANEDAVDPAMRDAARLRGAMIRVDTDEPKAFEQRYGRFSAPGFAFHNSMRELLALAALKINDMATAGRYLDEIIVDPGAPSGLRNRAEAFRAIVTAGPATAMTAAAPTASVTALNPPPAAAPSAAVPAVLAPPPEPPAAVPSPLPAAPAASAPPAAPAATDTPPSQ